MGSGEIVNLWRINEDVREFFLEILRLIENKNFDFNEKEDGYLEESDKYVFLDIDNNFLKFIYSIDPSNIVIFKEIRASAIRINNNKYQVANHFLYTLLYNNIKLKKSAFSENAQKLLSKKSLYTILDLAHDKRNTEIFDLFCKHLGSSIISNCIIENYLITGKNFYFNYIKRHNIKICVTSRTFERAVDQELFDFIISFTDTTKNYHGVDTERFVYPVLHKLFTKEKIPQKLIRFVAKNFLFLAADACVDTPYETNILNNIKIADYINENLTKSKLKTIKHILKHKKDENSLKSDIKEALFPAVCTDDINMVDYLMVEANKYKINASRLRKNGKTLLEIAIDRRCGKSISALVSNGYNSSHSILYGPTTSSFAKIAIKFFIKNSAKINLNYVKENKTSLIHAIDKMDKEMIKVLIGYGADPIQQIPNRNIPLIEAYYTRADLAFFMIEECGVNPNGQNSDGFSLLMAAAELDDVDTIRKLKSLGCDFEIVDSDGKNALFYSVNTHRELILNGCRPDQSDNNGYSPFFKAVRDQNIELVKLYLEFDFDFLKCTTIIGRSVFAEIAHHMPDSIFIESVNIFCNMRNKTGLLDLESCFAALFRKGISPNVFLPITKFDQEDKIFLMWLVGKGADINTTDEFGNNSLMYAVMDFESDLGIFEGTDLSVLNKKNESAFSLALKYGNDFSLFFDQNVLNVFDSDGDTPLLIALKKGNLQAVVFLLDNGAKVTENVPIVALQNCNPWDTEYICSLFIKDKKSAESLLPLTFRSNCDYDVLLRHIVKFGIDLNSSLENMITFSPDAQIVKYLKIIDYSDKNLQLTLIEKCKFNTLYGLYHGKIDPFWKVNENDSLLTYSFKQNAPAKFIVNIIKDHKLINKEIDFGETRTLPLIYAGMQKKTNLIIKLIDAGADSEAVDSSGRDIFGVYINNLENRRVLEKIIPKVKRFWVVVKNLILKNNLYLAYSLIESHPELLKDATNVSIEEIFEHFRRTYISDFIISKIIQYSKDFDLNQTVEGIPLYQFCRDRGYSSSSDAICSKMMLPSRSL